MRLRVIVLVYLALMWRMTGESVLAAVLATIALGILLRAVAKQDRVDPGKGNIAGQDIGPTAGFGVLSINGGWRISKALTLTGGVDNLLDKSYAEHISRSGAMVPGYVQTTRVNEPGRTLWLKLQLSL